MTVRPTSDVATTGWRTAVGAASPIYAEVDESAYDDADYASAQIAGLTPLVLGLGATVAAGTHRIPVRLKCSAGAQDVVVRLLNGSGVEQGASAAQTINTSPATYSFTVTTTGSATRIEIGVGVGGVTLSWTQPTQDESGASMTPSSYSIEAGAYAGDTQYTQTVNNSAATSYDVASFLPSGTWYCRVYAWSGANATGARSLPSADVAKTIP